MTDEPKQQPAEQTTAIQPAQQTKTALAYNSELNDKARELVTRLKFMIVNGKKLEDVEVYALAQFSVANDLNPFAGESYYIPGIGAIPGIAGWRKKAQEQLEFEAAKLNMPGAHIWVEYRDAAPGEAIFGTGDIARVCILHDWLTSQRWRREYFETARQLKELGSEKPLDDAKFLVGEEPCWTGLGVVMQSETFSRDGKPEKFDRIERANKRAEKVALRKRFPRINLPDVEIGIEAQVTGVYTEPPQLPTLTNEQKKFINAMGWVDPSEAPADPEPQPMGNEGQPYTDSQPEQPTML